MADVREHKEYFINRLKKKKRELIPWARKHDIEAFRLYDRDLPEVPLTADIYGSSLLVYDYRKDKGDIGWMEMMKGALRDVTGFSEKNLFVHQRHSRSRGQYDTNPADVREMIIREQGLRFLVRLGRYADSGLFPDHRLTRRFIQEWASHKDVLNLYAYTGAFSVYAAKGEAASTLSVDLSRTYCRWARKNLELNGIPEVNHKIENSDVFAFLKNNLSRRWDMIIIDPPTFSVSKKMDYVFDIKRDHVSLIRTAFPLLKEKGVILFSTNAHKFKMAQETMSEMHVEEITEQTIPEDYRQHRPHRCWVIRKAG